MDSVLPLVVLVAKVDGASLSVADRASRTWVYVVLLDVGVSAEEAAIVPVGVKARLPHMFPVPAWPHSR